MSPTDFDAAAYRWAPQPEAAQLIDDMIQLAVDQNRWLDQFQQRLLAETGTRLPDWLDHIAAANTSELMRVGFQWNEDCGALSHPGGVFPRVLPGSDSPTPVLAIKVEDVDTFLAAQGLRDRAEIAGESNSPLRIAAIDMRDGSQFHVVERHGYCGFTPDGTTEPRERPMARALESFRARQRPHDDPEAGFQDALMRFERAEAELGPGRPAIFSSNQSVSTGSRETRRLGRNWQDRTDSAWAGRITITTPTDVVEHASPRL